MKKVLSLVLAGSMILSSMSMAFAATAPKALTDIAGNDYETAIEALVALDVVSGYEDATFRPAKTITRAELAKLLVEALGYGDLVAGAKASFSDTQNHWSNGYVAIANGTGLVIGYPNGTFLPDQTVTYDEAYTMIVRALGYTDASLKGTWPTNFKVKAIDLGLTDDVKMATSSADRGGVAQALYNALEADLVEVDADNVAEKTGDILIDKIANLDDDYDVTPATLDADSNKFGGNIVDLAPYMYQNLEVYTNDDDEVVFVKDSNSLVVEGTIDTAASVTATQLPIKDADGTVTKVTTTTTAIYYNGAQVDSYNMADLKTTNTPSYEKIIVVAKVDTDEDDVIDASEITGVVATQQTKVAVIDNVYKEGRIKIDTFNLPVDSDGDVDLDNITVTGDADTLADIQEDDVVVAYEAKDASAIKLVVSRNTVEGTVTRLASDAVYVDGTKYSASKTSGSILGPVKDATLTDVLALEDEGTFYLDNNNKVVYFDGESATPTDYAVVLGSGNGSIDANGVIDNTYAIDDYPAIKLATMDDEAVIYDVFVEIDEDDATLTDAATDEDGDDIVTTSGTAILKLNVALTKGDVVKYSLNADGQIESLEVVKVKPVTLSKVDTTLASFKLADDAVVFDSGDDYAVASESDFEDIIEYYGVRNENGEFEVIVTGDLDAEATDTTIAVVKSAGDVNAANNADGDKIQVATVYMNGEKQDVSTDGDVEFTGVGIYEVEFDGDVIVGITTTAAVSAKIADISTSSNMVELTIDGTTDWYAIADDATVLDIKSGTTSTYEFIDIYDLDENDAIKVVINADGEITYLAGPALALK